MKNKKRKQERQARLERDDFENRIREEQTTHRHIDRTKVLLGSGGDVASDSEDEFDEFVHVQLLKVLERSKHEYSSKLWDVAADSFSVVFGA